VVPSDPYEIYDLRLSANSPCIDAARGSQDGFAVSPIDVESHERKDVPGTANTGVGTPNYVDMGAYEYQP
jgi:hypothetical protein